MTETDQKNILRYKTAAESASDALPLGNGVVLAFVRGGAATEYIDLWHEAFWSGYPDCARKEPDYRAFYTEEAMQMRRDMASRLMKESTVSEDFAGKLAADFPAASPEAFISPGQIILRLEQAPGSELALYEQSLNLQEGIHHCRFTFTGGSGDAAFPLREYERECFVSADENIFAMSWQSLDKAPMNLVLDFSSAFKQELLEQAFDENTAMSLFAGQGPDTLPLKEAEDLNDRAVRRLPNHKSKRFVLGILVRTEGEKVSFAGAKNGLALNGVTRFELYFILRSEALDPAAEQQVRNELAALTDETYEQLRERHRALFSRKFSAFDISLTSSLASEVHDEAEPSQDTASRLSKIRHAPVFQDAEFYALLIRYARYLSLISLPKIRVFPMFGAENGEGSQSSEGRFYHLDRPFSAAYQAAGLLGTAAEAKGVFAGLPGFLAGAKRTAEECYGLKGAVCHSVSDVWGYSDPAAVGKEEKLRGLWPFGLAAAAAAYGVILSYLPYEESLKERTQLLELVQEGSRFCRAFLKKDADGKFVFGPLALSDEEAPELSMYAFTAEGQAYVKSLFRQYADLTSSLLKNNHFPDVLDEELYREIVRILPDLREPFSSQDEGRHLRLLPFAGADRASGMFLSAFSGLWLGDADAAERADYRRVFRSALFRMPEKNERTLLTNAELRTVMGEGDKAFHFVQRKVTALPSAARACGLSSSLLLNAPFFSAEGNMSLALVLLHLFVREKKDGLELLPALPLDISAGEIKGLCLRNELTADFSFAERLPEKVVLYNHGREQRRVTLSYRKKTFTVDIPAGETFTAEGAVFLQ